MANKKTYKALIIAALSLFLSAAAFMTAQGASIVGSRHDLSSSGQEPCAFCHTPHGGDPSIAPLWNRTAPNPASFDLYASDTMANLPGQPNSASLACFSCHDGVNADADSSMANDVALLNVPGSGTGGSYVGNCNCHNVFGGNPALLTDKMFIGPNLTNDHPISMPYPTPVQDPNFETTADVITAGLKLYGATNTVECPSCHNVHDPANTPFLRKSNSGSELCYTCHIK